MRLPNIHRQVENKIKVNKTYCQTTIITKLRSAVSKFGVFWAHITYFLLAWVGLNHFVNIKFTKRIKEILDPNYHPVTGVSY